MEFIGTKICTDLVHITWKSLKRKLYSAAIKCPYCVDNISVSQVLNDASWNVTNLDMHLTSVHKSSNKQVKKSDADINAKFTQTTGYDLNEDQMNDKSIADATNDIRIGDTHEYSSSKMSKGGWKHFNKKLLRVFACWH